MLNNYEIDWQAIAAIATLSAVIVALIPTFTESKRREAVARNVRLRLLAYLMVLREVAKKCSPEYTIILSEEELKVLHALSSMMSELSVLEQDEHDRLWQLMADLKYLEAYPGTVNRMDKNTVSAIEEIINMLGKTIEKRRSTFILWRK